MIFLFKLLARLPLSVLHGLGILLGWSIYLGPGRFSARIRHNVAESGVCDSPQACKRLVHQAISEFGKSLIELLPVWLRPYRQTLALIRGTSGLEHIDGARAAGKGIIIIAPHIGCFEIINQYFSAQHPFTAMYKPSPQPMVDAVMLAGRQRGQARLVPTDLSGVRALLAALKRHEAIGILPDQVASAGDGVWAPFLGRPAYTPTLTASLQRKTRAAAFFVAAERLDWGRGFHLHIVPVKDGDFPEAKVAAAISINQGVEDMVRRFPAQYMWGYNRHKRPGSAPLPTLPSDAS